MTMELRTGVNRKNDGPTRIAPEAATHVPAGQALLRRELGEVLRAYRQRQGRTLREVSSDARVSLGYLSEVERGQKEASSELLASICRALNVPLSHVLRLVADRIDLSEGRVPPHMRIPDEVPDELVRAELAKR
ncbi:helix-turn-helix transcriptional regulator [Actinobaculum sp. 352]|uniref:helix-turn-helix domain-containing protein n=1 Tax=Actinobaculum sp. 352 TaxID=2490946 RepID=UPI000F7DC2FD|nr:helix-turn-helix transcriptional regulator [Actinobaculum sp. 352]RTE47959.1 XRE family transcriptional regulator [Actinobaculum sp. 352]